MKHIVNYTKYNESFLKKVKSKVKNFANNMFKSDIDDQAEELMGKMLDDYEHGQIAAKNMRIGALNAINTGNYNISIEELEDILLEFTDKGYSVGIVKGVYLYSHFWTTNGSHIWISDNYDDDPHEGDLYYVIDIDDPNAEMSVNDGEYGPKYFIDIDNKDIPSQIYRYFDLVHLKIRSSVLMVLKVKK